MGFPYENIEANLLSNRYEIAYEEFMPLQNKDKIETTPDQPSYWSEYAENFQSKHKTRAAAAVAIKMETHGEDKITMKIREVLRKVVSLAQGI